MVYNLLTELDKVKIDSYRDAYANAPRGERKANIETILSHWNEAKSKYLKTLFGDKLIITKDIEFKEGNDELYHKMEDVIYNDTRIYRFMHTLYKPYAEKAENHRWDDPEYKEYRFVMDLFSTQCLIDNTVDKYTYFNNSNVFELTIKDSVIKIQKGMKPIRIISKIANAYNIGITPDEDGISDFEYFRRKHSLAINQKMLKGELCLSIHPLDYMTMSDNDAGWDSCMSWENDGEYKQGTVEMMNSPCVIVAYLSSGPEDYSWFSSDYDSDICRWNSKKWRSLFIVDKEFIINVRSYPYDNANLVKEAIREIAKLSGWGAVEPERYMYLEDYDNHRSIHKPVEINGRKIAIDFRTQAMYNDFGANHYIALNPNSTEDIITDDYNYSGASMCVWCGETDQAFIGISQGEGYLICSNCYPHWYCESCNDNYDDGEEYYTTGEGYHVCHWCWEEKTAQDITNEEYYLRENMVLIYLSTKENEPCFDCAETRHVYDENIGDSNWVELFKIAEPREAAIQQRWYTEIRSYVFPSDLTEEGLRAFGIENEDALKYYMGSNENS